ncbi:S-layer homology domain-containing protein [Flintibacter sp. HCN-6482]|uniref:S-layer homology domain-containing protein n=1 Tax=Flintibacter sp. HCN-6482 TaxID=3134672 RepID=UPI0030BC860D
MKKKLLSTLMAMIMVLSMFPAAALEESVDPQSSGTTATEASGQEPDTTEDGWTEVSDAEALGAALTNGGNIKLTGSIEVSEKQSWTVASGTTVVLDLNGHSITSTYNAPSYFLITVNGGSLTLEDSSEAGTGKIEIKDASSSYPLQLKGNGSSFTMNGGTITAIEDALDIYTSAQNTTVTINGGTMKSQSYSTLAIRGKGTVVKITGGLIENDGSNTAFVSSSGSTDSESIVFNMTGGKMTSTGTGILTDYALTVNIGGEAEIETKGTGIAVKGTTILNVEGGSIKSGAYGISADYNNTVNITGGTIETTSYSSAAVKVGAQSQAAISGGTIVGKKNLDGSADNITVTGGTFQNADGGKVDVSDYLPEGTTQDESGNVVVDESTAVASIGNVGYTTLAAAVEAAKNGDIITLLKPVEITESLKINKAVVIDGKDNTLTAKDCAALQITADLDSLTIQNLIVAGETANENYVASEIMAAPYMGLGTYNMAYGVGDLKLNNVTIQGFDYGLYFSSSTTNDKPLSITANDLTIQDCYIKGVYLEKLTNSSFTDCKFLNNGDDAEQVSETFSTWMCGVDLNLKYGTYEDITFTGCTFTGNGANRGTALHIKARDDGSYATNDASLDGVTIEGCVFSENNAVDSGAAEETPYGPVVLGEPGKDNKTPVNVSIQPDVTYTDNLKTDAVFTVTFDSNGGNAVPTQMVEANQTITLPTPTRSGSYTFQGWYEDGTKIEQKEYQVTKDVTLVAQWTYTGGGSGGGGGSSSYSISVDKNIDNGSVTVSPKSASSGRTVTITVKADEGYELDELTVTDKNGDEIELTDKGDGKYTFKMPRSKVTIEASFVEIDHQDTCPAAGFRDVDEDAWYHEAVDYALDNGLMSGVSDREFAPGSTLTRAMVAQMLYSLEGKPAAGRADFADVAEGAWYADAISWAAGEGIVSGYGDTFGPNDPITREQLAAILYRYAQNEGYKTSQSGKGTEGYLDASSISSYAVKAMDWAVNAGLLSGKGNNTLAPTAGATRAEVAQIFMNFCEDIAK